MDTNSGIQPKIYLIGSFHSFRDRIIDALPDYSFADPRRHRQSSLAKMVVDDMNEAEACPIAIAVFPKGKSRGVMSYCEIGSSLVSGNTLLTVDEDENSDPLLKQLTQPDHYFTSLDEAIGYLASKPDIELNHRQPVQSKYPAGTAEPVPLNKVYFCGKIDREMGRIIENAKKARPEREFIMRGYDHKDFLSVADFDLIVANFPGCEDWDRHACLMLGAAYSHDISTIVMDGHSVKYPPLQAIARRQMTQFWMSKYITKVEDLRIESESGVMYNLFKEEAGNQL